MIRGLIFEVLVLQKMTYCNKSIVTSGTRNEDPEGGSGTGNETPYDFVKIV